MTTAAHWLEHVLAKHHQPVIKRAVKKRLGYSEKTKWKDVEGADGFELAVEHEVRDWWHRQASATMILSLVGLMAIFKSEKKRILALICALLAESMHGFHLDDPDSSRILGLVLSYARGDTEEAVLIADGAPCVDGELAITDTTVFNSATLASRTAAERLGWSVARKMAGNIAGLGNTTGSATYAMLARPLREIIAEPWHLDLSLMLSRWDIAAAVARALFVKS